VTCQSGKWPRTKHTARMEGQPDEPLKERLGHGDQAMQRGEERVHADAIAASSATTMNATIRRLRTEPPSCSQRPEPVPEAAHGLYISGFGCVGLDLRPQPLHARVHESRVVKVVVFPYEIEKLLTGEHLPRRVR
jgi:hypothetical protein